MLRYLTSGESHGPGLTAIVEGLPAGLAIEPEHINRDLRRRQGGYGRGGRMKIEKDAVRILSGVRFGQTLGSPITLHVVNRDYEHWSHLMDPEPVEGAVQDGWGPRPESGKGVVTRPRPGHADLAGAIKYRQRDVRNILERASARETTMRVAVGALAKRLLEEFGIRVIGHVVNLAGIEARVDGLSAEAIAERAEASPVRCADEDASRRMVDRIDEAKAAGDTLGGIWEVIVTGVPPGLGSHVQADRRLDTRLAAAVMSIPAHKGVEVGLGFRAALMPGSRVHDEIFWGPPPEGDERAREALYPGGPVWGTGYWRGSNHAGGLEGGITNGLPIVVRGAMKPISTLYNALQSVDMQTKEPQRASVQRSDICALPAAAVVGEAAVAIEVARALLEKFGGDTVAEMREAFERYRAYLQEV